MRITPGILLLVGIATVPGTALGQSKLFRAIPVAEGQLELGKRFTLIRSVASRPDDSTIALRHDAFGGAKELHVRHDGKDVIRALLFRYEASTDFAAKLKEYEEALGQPTQNLDRGAAGRRVIWRDAQTLFELGWEQAGTGRRYYTIMRDLAKT